MSWQWSLVVWFLTFLNTGRSSRSKQHRCRYLPGILTKNHQLFNRASPFTSAWHYCWPIPSASSSGSASVLRPLSLFRFLEKSIKSRAPVTNQIDILTTTHSLSHFISPECPHECGDVCSHPPLRVHQQQGGCSTSFSSKPSFSRPSNVLWQKIGGSSGVVKVVESHSEVLLAVYPRVLFLHSLCCPTLKERTNYSYNKII